MTSVMDCKKADCWALASSEFRFSDKERTKFVPASEANGDWAKLAIPNMGYSGWGSAGSGVLPSSSHFKYCW
jgi:hypothetical protein